MESGCKGREQELRPGMKVLEHHLNPPAETLQEAREPLGNREGRWAKEGQQQRTLQNRMRGNSHVRTIPNLPSDLHHAGPRISSPMRIWVLEHRNGCSKVKVIPATTMGRVKKDPWQCRESCCKG